jgi:hypothetical protein
LSDSDCLFSTSVAAGAATCRGRHFQRGDQPWHHGGLNRTFESGKFLFLKTNNPAGAGWSSIRIMIRDFPSTAPDAEIIRLGHGRFPSLTNYDRQVECVNIFLRLI